MKVLHLTFKNSEGKKHTFIPSLAKEDWTADEVRTKMEALKALHIFKKDEVDLFCEVDSAKYVQTLETELF
ncbi:hypothetical protein IGI37_000794 [Enterococcus sp. AZ194]|uniref:DUF2922 domain-containing protein n=1 Tax=Enterococcus sp. AZ194 TaxID=2774629 RepID=UPI003F214ED3